MKPDLATDCSAVVERRPLLRTAKRIVQWTSNALVAGVVLVAGLAFGRQLTSWWAVGPPAGSQTSTRGLGSSFDTGAGDAAWPRLEFDLPIRLDRHTVVGPQAAVLAALREQCRRSAEAGVPAGRTPGPEEHRMLQDTAGMVPVEQAPGKWKMYQVDDPIPLVVVTDWGDDACPENGAVPSRLLAWGLAMPAGAEQSRWTLFACVPAAGATDAPADPLAMPMPPGAERRMALRGDHGAGVLLLIGSGQMEEWMLFFDDWFRNSGWSVGDGRQADRPIAHRRYVQPGQNLVVEVAGEADGELRVMLTVSRR